MTRLPSDSTVHRYKRHRFPAEIVAHAVWLYYRFPLSLRDVEDLLAERGIDVSFQTVSEWAVKFGRKFANHLRERSRASFADKWHLDEMVVSIKGTRYWLWRAVDANGYVLDALLQSRRNKKAALRLMRKLHGQVRSGHGDRGRQLRFPHAAVAPSGGERQSLWGLLQFR